MADVKNQAEKTRVRFAPSPTGIPHIGGIRTALFNFLLAKKNHGKFFLRIEDTDRKRYVKEAEEAIFGSLKWLGLDWDGDVVYQSERKEIYREHAEFLLKEKAAYEKDGAVWAKMPDNKVFSWTDLVGNKQISFEGKNQEDFVILKSDGFPTYHLANVVDDHFMNISHVIRGEEWISSVPKHIFLYESFGWKIPEFAHLPVILGPDKGKLSKRHGAKSALDYKEEGYLKEAVLNYVALLGWNPGGEEEIFKLDEMIEKFNIDDVNTSNPKFDSQKLEWMNGEWIRSLSVSDLKVKLTEFYKDDEETKTILKNDSSIDPLLEIAQTRIKTFVEFKGAVIEPFFQQHSVNLDGKEQEIVSELDKVLSNLDKWDEQEIFAVFKDLMGTYKIKMPVFYKIFTGKERGLPLPKTLEIIGKEKTLKLLKND